MKRYRPISRCGKEEGYVLMAAAVFSFVLMIGGMAVFSVSMGENRNAHYQDDYWQAYFLAEAAIERGRAQLLADASWRAGFTDIEAGSGTYSLAISDTVLAGVPNPVKLVGTGTVGRASRSIEILGGVDITAFEHTLIVKQTYTSWSGGINVGGLLHVGSGENRLPASDAVGLSDFPVNPPPIHTEAAYFPNSTYYTVRARHVGPKWEARIYDRDGIDISSALGDSLDGHVTRSGNRITYTFYGNAQIAHYFDETAGIFSMAPGDSGIVVDFGAAPISGPPGQNGYALIIMTADTPMTIHTTIINSRFTGSTDADRWLDGSWYGGALVMADITIAPYNGVGLIVADLLNLLSQPVWIGTGEWPALACITNDLMNVLSAVNVTGELVCWGDWMNLSICTIEHDPGFKRNLPPYLLDIGSGDIQGTLEIAGWREI